MNYYAHGFAFLTDPYFLAGTAVPDWLSVADRKVRLRSRNVEPFRADPDPTVASLAAGVVRHLHDDRWFHQTRAFAELSLSLTQAIRELLPADESFRPSFLGHILVEILLDAALIADAPERLDAYYAVMAQADPRVVNDAVNRLATRPTERLRRFQPLFCSERFLYDYADDAKLLTRLNYIMHRVHLPPLPDEMLGILAVARRLVAERRAELLPPDRIGGPASMVSQGAVLPR